MSDVVEFDPVPLLAEELALPAAKVAAVVSLLVDGNTVPFIARYRKEATGGMDEVQIRTIEERRTYLIELHERRTAILASIAEQGKLTDELKAKIMECTTKAALEDLYLPYKPKRRTRAIIAREKGLEPLALRILAQPADGNPEAEAAAFVDVEKGVADVAEALKGARDIVAEVLAETAEIRAFVRDTFAEEGFLVSEAVAEKTGEPTKFEQYYNFREAVKNIPSHRFLAIRRGESEGILRAHIEVDADKIIERIKAMAGYSAASPFAAQLAEGADDSYRRLIASSVENDVRVDLKMRSDRAAVDVFADNLRNLLMAAPLGTRSVIGIDPGLRTGCKCVAVDSTGKFLDTITIFLAKGENALAQARRDLLAFIDKYNSVGIAVGNGTGGRETEQFVRKLLAEEQRQGMFVILVNEAGASVYSASDIAREEFPELDLTIRGAISIARRLQDPLAELVKIDPKAIGVGQYQHDVHQPLLQKKLGEVVESCVNHVGVELNTASAPLLSYVAGIGKSVAKKIVAHREQNGAFKTRKQLLDVSGLGPRAFEQSAGFLRIHGGEEILDSSAVHPERYDLVFRIAADLSVQIQELVGNPALVDSIDITKYIGDGVGEPTLRDIVSELKKPGRDPRESFEPPSFRDDVNTLEDLKPGMALDGVVTNVTAFGAFVDIGVHQDGLVHVSQLSNRFVKDPSEVVKVGDKLKVRVLEVDLARKRISLTARTDGGAAGQGERGKRAEQGGERGQGQKRERGQGQKRERGGERRGGEQGGERRGGEQGGERGAEGERADRGERRAEQGERRGGGQGERRRAEQGERRPEGEQRADGGAGRRGRDDRGRDDRGRGRDRDGGGKQQQGDRRPAESKRFTHNPFANALSDLRKR